MKIRKVLGGFAWVILAALLIFINVAAGGSDSVFDQTEGIGVSAVVQ